MLTIRDLSGNEEHLTDFKELTLNRKVNGEKWVSLMLLSTPHNRHSFSMTEEESILTFNNEEYVIKKVNERGIGNTTVKRVEAIHKFYVDMINKQQPNIHNGSMMFSSFLSFVFDGTGYTFSIIDQFNAQPFENLGNDNRLSLLQKGLERYKAEMEIVGNNARFKKQVGNDTDFQFRYGHNIKSIEKNVDSTNLATVIRGTGAEGITAYYRSPNADIVGEIDSPPVNDERFSSESTLLAEMKARLQDTPEFSITIDFVDLRAAGYPWTVPNEGDRVYVIYELMNDLLIDTRILEITEVYNAQFQVIKTEVTLANHKKSFAGTMFDNVNKRLRDIVNDDGIIKYDVLDNAVKVATEALQSAQTELEFNNGIIAREKEDPNKLVLFNSAGLGISVDGGHTFNTAMTAEGIVADVITVGTLRGIYIEGVEISGSILKSELSLSQYTKIENAYLESRGNYARTWFGTTKNHDVSFRMEGGYLKAENIQEDKRLYFSDFGISTFINGYDDESPDTETHGSGVIEFFSHMYDENVRGLTLFSNRGTIGLRTMTRDIVLDSYRNTIVKSQNGLFTVEGNIFRSPVIGVPESGTNLYLGVNGDLNGEVRVTNKLFYNGGSPVYYPVRARGFITGYNNLYLQAPDEVMAVSSDMSTWGGSHTYTAFRASEYRNGSSIAYKTNIENLQSSGLNVINNLEVKQYILQSDVDEGNYSNWQVGLISELSPEVATQDQKAINLYKLLSYAVRAIQEQSDMIETLEQRINDIEMVV